MDHKDLDRRDFAKLTTAALGGILAGAQFGFAQDEKPKAKKKKKGAEKNPLLEEPHVCRGLNTCKNKGASGENACAGQGTCATAEKHTCKGENACKGQGGCGANPGENACKGKGDCAVPLEDKAWKKARTRFEALMKKEGKEVGEAPEKG